MHENIRQRFADQRINKYNNEVHPCLNLQIFNGFSLI